MSDPGISTVICLRKAERDQIPIGSLMDDVVEPCSKCGEEVIHRPHIPQPAVLLCSVCFVEELEAAPEDQQIEINVTPETIRELGQLALMEEHKGDPQ